MGCSGPGPVVRSQRSSMIGPASSNFFFTASTLRTAAARIPLRLAPDVGSFTVGVRRVDPRPAIGASSGLGPLLHEDCSCTSFALRAPLTRFEGRHVVKHFIESIAIGATLFALGGV